jgi:hypothetical protein
MFCESETLVNCKSKQTTLRAAPRRIPAGCWSHAVLHRTAQKGRNERGQKRCFVSISHFRPVSNFAEKMAFRFLLVSSFVSLGFPVSYRRAEFRKRGHIPCHPCSPAIGLLSLRSSGALSGGQYQAVLYLRPRPGLRAIPNVDTPAGPQLLAVWQDFATAQHSG